MLCKTTTLGIYITVFVFLSLPVFFGEGKVFNTSNDSALDSEIEETIEKECKYKKSINSEEANAELESNCLLTLGNKYFVGDYDLKQDIETAVSLWKVSSDLGDPEAQFNMGLAHFIYPSLGALECVSNADLRDDNEAVYCSSHYLTSFSDAIKRFRYYRNIARRRHLGNEIDFEREAYSTFTRSIAHSNLYLYFSSLSGHKGAQLALGFRYEAGLGVQNSCEAAFSNYLEVAKDCISEHREEGIVQYEELIRLSIPDWDPLKKLYSESENQNRHDLALNIAESGNIFIQLAVAKRYLLGSDGFPQNFSRSYKYLRKLAERAKELAGTVLDTASTLIYGEAIGLLGYMHALGLDGSHGKKDLDAASEYFSISAFIYNDPGGHNGMGYVYFHGCKGFEQNFRLSFHHFNESAHYLFPDAQYNLASLYLTGMGTSQSYSEALLWYTRAYEQGHIPSSYALAQMNFNGLGTNRDCGVAIKFLKNIIYKSPYVTNTIRDINNISSSMKNSGHKGRSLNGLKLFLTLKLAMTGHEPSLANIPLLIEKEYKTNNFWGASRFGLNRRMPMRHGAARNGSEGRHVGGCTDEAQFGGLLNDHLSKLYSTVRYVHRGVVYAVSSVIPPVVLEYLGFDFLQDVLSTETEEFGERENQRQEESDPWYLPQIFMELAVSQDNLDSMIKYADILYYGRGSELRFKINNSDYKSKTLRRSIAPEIHLNNIPNYLAASSIYNIVAYFTLRSRYMISSVSEACFNLGYMYQFGIGVKQNIGTAVSYYKRMVEVGHIGRVSNGILEIVIFLAKIHGFFALGDDFLASLRRKKELQLMIQLAIALLVLIAAKMLLKTFNKPTTSEVNNLNSGSKVENNSRTGENSNQRDLRDQ